MFFFTPLWGNFPFWLIFFRWVETTNQSWLNVYFPTCWKTLGFSPLVLARVRHGGPEHVEQSWYHLSATWTKSPEEILLLGVGSHAKDNKRSQEPKNVTSSTRWICVIKDWWVENNHRATKKQSTCLCAQLGKTIRATSMMLPYTSPNYLWCYWTSRKQWWFILMEYRCLTFDGGLMLHQLRISCKIW